MHIWVDYANRRISDKDIDNIICNQSINENKLKKNVIWNN